MERRLEGSWFRRGISLICIAVMVGIGSVALAQAPVAPPPNPPNQAPSQPIPPQQLDNLVAPIALYPDPLLGQVLAASTYPLELVEAKQWVQANPTLQGQQLTDAARQQPWDAAVQAMVAMPDVLNRLTEDIHWTTDLGDAFLAQQPDVMAAVQRMRVRAQANGKLQSTPQETVTTENQDGQAAVEIQPANPQVIYVPTYDPNYVWGAPDWGYYPPLWYPSYGFWWGPGINMGLCFGGWGGWGFGYGGFGWGWGMNWFGHGLFVNGGFFNHYGYHNGYGFGGRGFGGAGFRAGTAAWAHDPSHRLGVGYSNGRLNSRYGAASQASRSAMTARSAAASGGWQRFSQAGNANSFRGGSAQAGARGSQAIQGRQGSQSFAGRSQMNGQRYQAPAQRYQAPAQRYQAPAQRYQAPAQSFRSAPRMSAPSFGGGGARSFGGGGAARSFGGGGGGGGARSFGGGGGGGARSFGGGGGGGSHGGGGGGHGGGHR
jgi:hypothetical protein